MDVQDLRWDELRRIYRAERQRRGWTFERLAEVAGAPKSAITKLLDPKHIYRRRPTVIDAVDKAFDFPAGHGWEVLTASSANQPINPQATQPVRQGLEQLWAEVSEADHLSPQVRERYLARIKRLMAEEARQRAETERATAEIYQDLADSRSA